MNRLAADNGNNNSGTIYTHLFNDIRDENAVGPLHRIRDLFWRGTYQRDLNAAVLVVIEDEFIKPYQACIENHKQQIWLANIAPEGAPQLTYAKPNNVSSKFYCTSDNFIAQAIRNGWTATAAQAVDQFVERIERAGGTDFAASFGTIFYSVSKEKAVAAADEGLDVAHILFRFVLVALFLGAKFQIVRRRTPAR